MNAEEAKQALDELKQEGYTEEDISRALAYMYANGDLDFEAFEAFTNLNGYEINEDFKKMSYEEQVRLIKETNKKETKDEDSYDMFDEFEEIEKNDIFNPKEKEHKSDLFDIPSDDLISNSIKEKLRKKYNSMYDTDDLLNDIYGDGKQYYVYDYDHFNRLTTKSHHLAYINRFWIHCVLISDAHSFSCIVLFRSKFYILTKMFECILNPCVIVNPICDIKELSDTEVTKILETTAHRPATKGEVIAAYSEIDNLTKFYINEKKKMIKAVYVKSISGDKNDDFIDVIIRIKQYYRLTAKYHLFDSFRAKNDETDFEFMNIECLGSNLKDNININDYYYAEDYQIDIIIKFFGPSMESIIEYNI